MSGQTFTGQGYITMLLLIFLYYCKPYDNHFLQPPSFKPKCTRWRMHGCIGAQTQYLNLSVQSHRKHWVVCTKPKISSFLSENHPVKRNSLTLQDVKHLFSFIFIVNCNVLYDMQCLLSGTSITLYMIVQIYFLTICNLLTELKIRYSCLSFSLSLIYL